MKKVLIITAIILAIIAIASLFVFLLTREEDPWRDYYGNDDIYNIELTREIEDFPGTEFVWTAGSVGVKITNGTSSFIYGFPVWNVFFADLTGDGYDDICATVSVEEDGVESDRIIIHDYLNNRGYEVSDPGNYNFRLKQEGDKLIAIRESASDKSDSVTGTVEFKETHMSFLPDGE